MNFHEAFVHVAGAPTSTKHILHKKRVSSEGVNSMQEVFVEVGGWRRKVGGLVNQCACGVSGVAMEN